MFRANVRAMEATSYELQRQIRKLNQAIDDTERVMISLPYSSGMDGVRRRLRQEISRMEEQRNDLRRMMTSLQQIARIYRTCESNNIDYADDIRRRNRTAFNWFQINVTDVASERLKQIIF